MAAPTPDAFADAVARAKTLAAKFSGSATGSNPAPSMKRPAESDNGDSTQPKRVNVNDKIAQAAEAAARVVQKLGGSGIPSMANGGGSNMDGNVSTVQVAVPDKYVGLIIGKKGEQITAIQAESSCKVQVAQDSQGTLERAVTLVGTQDQISRARGILNDIIDKADRGLIGNSATPGGQSVIELTIPGPKVGLVIGKNGETIKKLQEDTGVKMVMIQENNEPTFVDKQLRISGDQNKLESARQMVLNLLASKDMGFPGAAVARGGGGGFTEVRVPRRAVGIVIGRGGDMLKKLSEETGCRVQFRQDGENDFELPERICQISGPPDSVQDAARRVQELVDSTLQGNMGNRPGPMNSAPPGSQSRTFAVPAEKAGLVIGKGGETVKDICRQTGSFIEIQKQPPPNPSIKVFNVSGSPSQIDHGIRLICERVGIPPPQGGPPMGGPGNPYSTQYPDAYNQQQPQQWGGHDPNSSFPTQYPGQPQPNQQPWGNQANWGGQQPQAGHPQSGGTPGQPQAGMPAPQINPSTGQPDYSQAWAEYYRRQGMNDYADAILRQASQGGGGAGPQSGPGQSQTPGQSPMQQPGQQPLGGQMVPQPGQPGVPNAGPTAVGQQPAQGGYDYQQWQQYQQQYQQWQQQYAGWQQQNPGAAPQPGAPGIPPQQPTTSMSGR